MASDSFPRLAPRPPRRNWVDRAIDFVAPRLGLRRIRARIASEMFLRHYEAAATGRRTSGWKRPTGDANAVTGPALASLRASARDLVRNNGFAESALTTIVDHVVGWGIVAKPKPANARAAELWAQWTETTACDADGQHNFSGLQKLVMRTVAESGEVLVRRRWRRPGPPPGGDGLPLPFQLQVLDPDYLDTSKSSVARTAGGQVVGQVVHGVEFDAIGRRSAYWLFPEHPGSDLSGGQSSVRVPAENVLHIFRNDRPGQVRGVSWFAPVMLLFKDFDDVADATVMKQKVSALLAVVVTDPDGANLPLGQVTAEQPFIDTLEPGAVLSGPPGRAVQVVQPPSVREYPDFVRTVLRAIATGLGVSYEDLCGDYTATNFSAGRMSRLRHWARVEDWRWRLVIPQFCDPAWAWAMQAAAMMDSAVPLGIRAEWSAQPMPMLEPDREALAYQRRIRNHLISPSEALREQGYDPEVVFAEIAADNKVFDSLKLTSDADPRKTTAAGQLQMVQAPASPTSPSATPAPSEGDDGAAPSGSPSASPSASPAEDEEDDAA